MQYLCIVYAGTGAASLREAEGTAIKNACIEGDNALFEAGNQKPRMLAYRTSVKMVPDDSPEAKAKLK